MPPGAEVPVSQETRGFILEVLAVLAFVLGAPFVARGDTLAYCGFLHGTLTCADDEDKLAQAVHDGGVLEVRLRGLDGYRKFTRVESYADPHRWCDPYLMPPHWLYAPLAALAERAPLEACP